MDADTAMLSATDTASAPEVATSSPPLEVPCLELGHRVYRLAPGDNLVGRGGNAAVQLDAASVSRRHALIRIHGDGATLEDLASRNGTVLRDARVVSPVPIHDGDAIRIGTVWLVYRGPAGDPGDD